MQKEIPQRRCANLPNRLCDKLSSRLSRIFESLPVFCGPLKNAHRKTLMPRRQLCKRDSIRRCANLANRLCDELSSRLNRIFERLPVFRGPLKNSYYKTLMPRKQFCSRGSTRRCVNLANIFLAAIKVSPRFEFAH